MYWYRRHPFVIIPCLDIASLRGTLCELHSKPSVFQQTVIVFILIDVQLFASRYKIWKSCKVDTNQYFWEVIKYSTLMSLIHIFQEEIKCRLKAGNSCYYSVQTLLYSRLLSNNLKIKIYKTIVLPVVQYGCETWSLT